MRKLRRPAGLGRSPALQGRWMQRHGLRGRSGPGASPVRVRVPAGEAATRNRIALYLGDSTTEARAADLRPYFEGARASGLRIVTVKREARGVSDAGRPVLERLVGRMEAGEFEAIVTVVDGDVAPSTLPRPSVHGDAWVAHSTERR